MKCFKKAACMLLALTLALGVLVVPSVPVQAASKATLDSKKAHVIVNTGFSSSNDEIVVSFAKGDYKLKNVKSSSKNLKVTVTNIYSHSSKYDEQVYPYGSAALEFYAKKKGTYKVSFDVVDKAGKKTSSHKVTVYADSTEEIKNVTLNGKYFSGYTTKTKAKFKVTLGKKAKLKYITMTTYDKKGKAVTKKIKNNQTVTLGNYRSISKNSNDSWSSSLLAETRFEVFYKSEYTGKVKSVTYSVSRWPQN